MGICATKPKVLEEPCTPKSPLSPLNENNVSNCESLVSNCVELNVVSSSIDGCKLRTNVSTASYAASKGGLVAIAVEVVDQLNQESHSVGSNRLLMCIFEAAGSQGTNAMQLCKSQVFNCFESTTVTDTDANRLKAALQILDNQLKAAQAGQTSACLALVDMAKRTCCVASVGNVQCLLGSIQGSFNSKRSIGTMLSSNNTLALGMKNTKLNPHITERKLTTSDQTLVLGTAGLWKQLSPMSATLRTHLYEELMQEQHQIYGNSEHGMHLEDNTAKHLLTFALSKVADSQAIKLGRPYYSIEDLQDLPIKASDSSLKQCRKDVHDDMSCVVISLRWQQDIMSSPMNSARCCDYKTAVARQHWAQLRMLCNFVKLHRREMLTRWHETSKENLKKARKYARQLENELYYQYQDASIKVNIKGEILQNGVPVEPGQFNIQAISL